MFFCCAFFYLVLISIYDNEYEMGFRVGKPIDKPMQLSRTVIGTQFPHSNVQTAFVGVFPVQKFVTMNDYGILSR